MRVTCWTEVVSGGGCWVRDLGRGGLWWWMGGPDFVIDGWRWPGRRVAGRFVVGVVEFKAIAAFYVVEPSVFFRGGGDFTGGG